MTKFTKFALTFATIALVAIVTAALVVRAYHFRGYFSVGGEWLIPAVCAAVWRTIKEVKNLYNVVKNGSEACGNDAE